MSSNYDVGTRAWQPDTEEGWVASEVVKKQVDGDKVILIFKLENGEVRSFHKRANQDGCNNDLEAFNVLTTSQQ